MKRDGERPLPHLHGAAHAQRRRHLQIHQMTAGAWDDINPIYVPGRPHRLRHQPDVHGDGHARRRVRARTRGAAARDDHASTAATRTATSSRRTSRTPSRRSSATTGASASRSGSTSARQRREASRRQPRRHAESRDRRPARQAGQRALHGERALAERDDRHRHRARPNDPRRARSSRSTRETTTIPSASTPMRTQTAGPAGHACLDEENVTFKLLTPNVPTDGSDPSPVGRYREPSVLPGRAHSRVVGAWAGQRRERAVADAARLRDLRLRPGDAARISSIYNDRTTWDLNALAVAPRAEPPVIAQLQYIQDSTDPGPHRLGRRHARRASTRRSTARSSTTCRSAQALSRAPSRCASSRASRARPVKGVIDVRSHDVRGRRRSRRGSGLRRRKLARERPAVPPDAPPADRQVRPRDPQSAALDPGHARRRSPLRRLPRVAHRPGRARRSARTRRVAEQQRRRQTFTEAIAQTAPSTPGTRRCSRSSTAKCARLPQQLHDHATTR